MRNAPFVSALGDEQGKARWPLYGFAVYHSRERIKPRDQNSVIADRDCAPFVDRILVACTPYGCEVGDDRLTSFRHHRTDSSEEDRIRAVVFSDRLWIVAALCG